MVEVDVVLPSGLVRFSDALRVPAMFARWNRLYRLVSYPDEPECSTRTGLFTKILGFVFMALGLMRFTDLRR